MLDGKAIKAQREKRRLSLRMLAARMEDLSGHSISHETLRRVEEEEFDLSYGKCQYLALALGVALSEITKAPVPVKVA